MSVVNFTFEQELHEIQFYNHQVLFSNFANDYAKDSLQLKSEEYLPRLHVARTFVGMTLVK